ncbi:hypothetical protein FRB95_005402 [Tulasnella sp. JGI-2019a]|nr:hypothetical protein FRB95_005402 [Tulasnella sp. JGI-2019a]
MHLLQSLSFVPKRLFGYIIPVTLWLLVSSSFMAMFVLYHEQGPTGQRLGWQSWAVVNGDSSLPSSSSSGNATMSGGKEWWEAATLDAGERPASLALPLDTWAPLLPHITGLSEIAIRPCYFPQLANCAPKSTPEEDATKGKWVKVGPDLNQKTGLWYLNIYYRRTRRLDVPLITSIMVLAEDAMPPQPHSSWVKASGSLVDGVYPSQRPRYLWYKIQKPLAGIPQGVEVESLVTEIDVVYGDAGGTLWGFQKTNDPVSPEGKKDPVWIVFRKGMKPKPRTNPLHFSHNGTFKILQVADLHYSVSQGSCRDLDKSSLPSFLSSLVSGSDCPGDTLTQSLIARMLELEKPDLVVFTGDQLNGQTTSWSATSVIAKAIDEVIKANVPWTVVFGNHDDERTDLSRAEQMRVYQSFPGAIQEMEAGEQWVDGVGNYVVKVRSADPSATHLLTLYFLDSHAYAAGGWTFWKPADYDWIKQTQIEWFVKQSEAISPIERPFTPDGASDLAKVWPRNGLDERADKTLSKPNALVFFHIPLPEAYLPADMTSKGEVLSYGQMLEGEGSPKKNSGFFQNGILKATSPGPNGGTTNEVKVLAHGHCHITDQCKRVNGVWICFGGGGSFSGYSKIGFDRRFRVYDISDYGETIRTYKRADGGAILDDMILVGKGAKGA